MKVNQDKIYNMLSKRYTNYGSYWNPYKNMLQNKTKFIPSYYLLFMYFYMQN